LQFKTHKLTMTSRASFISWWQRNRAGDVTWPWKLDVSWSVVVVIVVARWRSGTLPCCCCCTTSTTDIVVTMVIIVVIFNIKFTIYRHTQPLRCCDIFYYWGMTWYTITKTCCTCDMSSHRHDSRQCHRLPLQQHAIQKKTYLVDFANIL